MPLQTSGPISIENIRNQIGLRPQDYGSRSLVYLSEYVGFTAPHAMSDFYGYPPYPPYGTFYTSYCSGCTLYFTYHDGSGGYYDSIQEYNSQICGCSPNAYYCLDMWNNCGIYQSPCYQLGLSECYSSCLLEGTLVKLSNGTEIAIESLTIGMELSSIVIGNMPGGDNFEILKQWSETNPTLSNTSSTVTQNTEHVVYSVLSFNDGLLTSSEDHIHVIKRNSVWFVMKANDILVGDSFINQNGSEQIINSIVKNTGSFKVYKLDVESNDIYIANGVITHNRKEDIF
jgi:hypothetical protein